jgi:serine/threonine protein kinase
MEPIEGDPDRPTTRVPGYTLGGLLGRGAYGEVWDATRLGDGLRVALKVLRGRPSEEARMRFRREARAAASVDSAHVPRVLEAQTDSDDALFIAYERL